MPPTPPYRPSRYTPTGLVTPAPLLVPPRPTLAAWVTISINADIPTITLRGTAIFSKFPGAPRDTSLDQNLDLSEFPGEFTLSGAGIWLSRSWVGVAGLLTLSGTGIWNSGLTVTSSLGLLTLEGGRGSGIIPTFASASAGVGEQAGANWLRWSKIGYLNFTQDRSNVAGQMPLPFKGTIYAILRRGASIICYAKNGVAVLKPADVAFGYTVLSNTGLKSKLAVIDTGDAHYYVDSKGRLYAVKDGLPELLDYREWLAGLGTVAMAFNPETRLLYIGDGTTGYLYNVDTGSFGKGPATVTGAGLQGGTLYAVASGTMTIPNFAVTTDILDFGTRKGKTIRYVEAGVDTTLTLEGSMDYRLEKQGAFASLDWYPFDSRGHCYLNGYGYEFRFKVRATSAGWFHLDRLQVFGVIHAH